MRDLASSSAARLLPMKDSHIVLSAAFKSRLCMTRRDLKPVDNETSLPAKDLQSFEVSGAFQNVQEQIYCPLHFKDIWGVSRERLSIWIEEPCRAFKLCTSINRFWNLGQAWFEKRISVWYLMSACWHRIGFELLSQLHSVLRSQIKAWRPPSWDNTFLFVKRKWLLCGLQDCSKHGLVCLPSLPLLLHDFCIPT